MSYVNWSPPPQREPLSRAIVPVARLAEAGRDVALPEQAAAADVVDGEPSGVEEEQLGHRRRAQLLDHVDLQLEAGTLLLECQKSSTLCCVIPPSGLAHSRNPREQKYSKIVWQ